MAVREHESEKTVTEDALAFRLPATAVNTEAPRAIDARAATARIGRPVSRGERVAA
jgi:hypothetical protein